MKKQNSPGHFGVPATFVLLLLLLNGCTKNENVVGNEQIIGSGRVVSQARAVGTFSGIQVTNVGKVFVTQDTVESLRIESDDNIIDRVVTSVSNGVLVVGLRDGSYNNVTLRIYASMRSIKRLESTGAADFSTVNSIQTDSIVCRIKGAGNIALTGSAAVEIVEITGAGNVNNFGLASGRCTAIITGTGNIEVNVTQQLDAVITGTGTITYAGNPAVIHQTITGVGSLRQRP
jgi:hypothetical protein